MSYDAETPPVDYDLREVAEFCDAVRNGHHAKVSELLNQSSVLARLLDEDGVPPLEHAVRAGHCAIVESLLSCGVGQSQINTALGISIQQSTRELSLMLHARLHSMDDGTTATPVGAPTLTSGRESVSDPRHVFEALEGMRPSPYSGVLRARTSDGDVTPPTDSANDDGSRLLAELNAARPPSWSEVLHQQLDGSGLARDGALPVHDAMVHDMPTGTADFVPVGAEVVHIGDSPRQLASTISSNAPDDPSFDSEDEKESIHFEEVVTATRGVEIPETDKGTVEPIEPNEPSVDVSEDEHTDKLWDTQEETASADGEFPFTPVSSVSHEPVDDEEPSEGSSDQTSSVTLGSELPTGCGEPPDPLCRRAVASGLLIAGWCLDISMALISLSDMVLHCMVAVQFGLDRNPFILFSAPGFASCFSVYPTLFLCDWTKGDYLREFSCLKRILLTCLVFPVAPLLPFIAWARWSVTRWRGQQVYDNSRDFLSDDQRDQVHKHNTWIVGDTSAAIHEASSWSSLVLGHLEAALPQHLRAHHMLHCDVARSAVHYFTLLMSITFTRRASPVYDVAVMVALANISIKACCLSRSFDIRVFLFKCALAVHDIFSFSYDVILLGATNTVMPWIVIGHFFAVVIFALAFGLHVLFVWQCSFGKALPCFAYFLLPLLFPINSMKLSWIILLDWKRPKVEFFPSHSAALAFLRSGDFDHRARHMVRYLVRCERRRISAGLPDFVHRRVFERRTVDQLNGIEAWALDGTSTLFQLFCVALGSSGTQSIVLGAIFVLIQLCSVTIPLLNVVTEGWESQNNLQVVLFMGSTVALFHSVLLLPSFWTYVKYCAVLPIVSTAGEECVLHSIEEYLQPVCPEVTPVRLDAADDIDACSSRPHAGCSSSCEW